MSDKHDPEIKIVLSKYLETGKTRDLEAFIRKLNTYYSTRLSNDEITKLSKMDTGIINHIKKGKYVEAVNDIRQICSKDLYSFATKFVYFVSNENSPMLDKFVKEALTLNFEIFYDVMTYLGKKHQMNFHDLDDYIRHGIGKETKRK
jgi:hypothetical protein